METIANASGVLVWPILIFVLLSAALWIFSWSRTGEQKRAENTVTQAKEKNREAKEGPTDLIEHSNVSQPVQQIHTENERPAGQIYHGGTWAEALQLAFDDTRSVLRNHRLWVAIESTCKKLSVPVFRLCSKIRNRTLPHLVKWSERFDLNGSLKRALKRSSIPLAIVGGLFISYLVGAKWLYSSMVSTSYSKLYLAYCSADAVTKVLSRQPSATNFAAAPTIDGCSDPPSSQPAPKQEEPKQPPRKALTKEDVFNLLNGLGLRDIREKTVKDLFENGQETKNRRLANWLISPDPVVYYVGMPTAELLVRLAGLLGSGYDIGKKPSDASAKAFEAAATELVCRTAGLAAVMSQQPLALDSEGRTIGQLLLAKPKIPTVREMLESIAPEKKIESSCAGDGTLSSFGLGRDFQAQTSDRLKPPLMSRPTTRVNDAEIVNIALAWHSWPEPPSINDPAILAFMRSIASEASGVQEVRDARIATNFFVGHERIAILIVCCFLGLCLLWQQAVNVVDVRDLRLIHTVHERLRGDSAMTAHAFEILKSTLYRHLSRSAPREILDAALEIRKQQQQSNNVDYDRVHRAAEHEMRILDRSRFFFLAGLPLLPTIGFIGTVRSLIEALAIADNIPRARDSVDQVNSVLDVTSTLSLCFSTTFMALTALLIFAPLDLWQTTGQRRVIEEAERQLDPGG